MDEPSVRSLIEALESVLYGKRNVIEFALVAAFGGGHLLIEDLPGVGKTTLGKALASLLGGRFQRVQCTADLMPSDLTGVNIFHPQKADFIFKPGPIFCHILLADELNRATPRAQSSLLEAMEESQVTIDRETHALSDPFWVIATQNPNTLEGTYPLPESQLDRFLLSISIGYPPLSAESAVLRQGGGHIKLDRLTPLFSVETWRQLRAQVPRVEVDESLIDYMLSVVTLTRSHPALRLGVSTRGALAWKRAAQALAFIRGRSYVTPDDLKTLAYPVLNHRLWLHRGSGGRGEKSRLIDEFLRETPVPR